jgi:hypothetical protein
MNARGFLPRNIVVTNMQPEPNNFAGATVAAYNGVKTTPPGPIVLVEQGGHWLDHPRHRENRAGRVLAQLKPPIRFRQLDLVSAAQPADTAAPGPLSVSA